MGNGAETTLTIRVNDREVDSKGIPAIKRMQRAAEDVGSPSVSSLGGRKPVETEEQQRRLAAFMGKDLPQAAKAGADAIETVESASAGAAEGLGVVGAVLGVVALAIAAVVAIAVGFAVLLYEIGKNAFEAAKAFSAYAIEIGNLAEETGLATETISALRHEADAQGRSFSGVESAVQSFRKTIGEAAAGSVEAKAQLKLLGIDGTKAVYDIDAAFKQAIATIVKAPDAMQQIRLSFAAFGDEGYKLLPFLKGFHGDVDAAIAKATELGIVLSGKDVDAAREFNRAYSDVQKQIEGIKNEFGKDFLDIVGNALRSFSGWLKENKDGIKDWATWTAQWVQTLIDKFKSLREYTDALAQQDHEMRSKFPETRQYTTDKPQWHSTLPTEPQSFGITPQMPDLTKQADPAVLEALRAKAEELRKQREAAAKAELAAQIQLFEMSASQLGSAYDKAFGDITDHFKETLNADEYQQSWDNLKSWYGDEINKLAPMWTKLVEEQTVASKKGAMEQEVIKRELEQKQQELSDKTLAHDDAARKAVRDAQKKATAETLAEAEARIRREIQLYDERDQADIDSRKKALAAGRISEQQYLDFVEQLELNELDNKKKKLQELLNLTTGDAKKRIDVQGQIAVVDAQIAKQKQDNEERFIPVVEAERDLRKAIAKFEKEDADASDSNHRRKAAALSQELDLRKSIQSLSDQIANGGANDQLVIEEAHLRDVLDYRNRELNAVIAVNKAQLELSHSMEISNDQIRAGVYEHLAQQKTLNEAIADGINKTYDAVTGQLDRQLDKLNEKAKGLLSFITEPLKAISDNRVSGIFTNLVDKLFPGMGAKLEKAKDPVLGELKDHTNLLQQIANNTSGGGAGAAGGLGGGGLGGILGRIFGGSGAGAGAGSSGGLSGTLSSEGDDSVGAPGSPGGSSSGSGGIFGALKGLFSTGEGGIFAPRKNQATGDDSKLGGILGGAGDLATLVGGFIGGRAGSILSKVGMGLSIGSMFGPIGAIAGGAIGLIASLFGLNSQRKKDEATRNQASLDAFSAINSQFDALVSDIRLGADPSSAISRGTAIGDQVRNQYLQVANSLTDKKTRNIALADVSRVDSLIAQRMAELQDVATRAKGSADVAKRILPEFAGGHYFADYFRPNGLIPGIFDSKDDMLAMLSRGEMVLNPHQQNAIRQMAGHDIFAGAGIPNYPRSSPSAKLASGGIAAGGGIALAASAPNIVVQPRFTLIAEGVTFNDNAKAWLVSDDGTRTLVDVVKKKQTSGDIR